MSTYRTPDPAAEVARLTRECERLRGELAAPAHSPVWQTADYLAAPVIIGGYPLGVALMIACIRLALPPWAGVAVLALGLAWWALALRWMQGGGR